MNENKKDRIQKQKKVQGLYRRVKQQQNEDIDEKGNNKVVIVIVNLCVGLGILVLLLNAFIKEF